MLRGFLRRQRSASKQAVSEEAERVAGGANNILSRTRGI